MSEDNKLFFMCFFAYCFPQMSVRCCTLNSKQIDHTIVLSSNDFVMNHGWPIYVYMQLWLDIHPPVALRLLYVLVFSKKKNLSSDRVKFKFRFQFLFMAPVSRIDTSAKVIATTTTTKRKKILIIVRAISVCTFGSLDEPFNQFQFLCNPLPCLKQ